MKKKTFNVYKDTTIFPLGSKQNINNVRKRRKLNLKRLENQLEQTKLDLENTINQAWKLFLMSSWEFLKIMIKKTH